MDLCAVIWSAVMMLPSVCEMVPTTQCEEREREVLPETSRGQEVALWLCGPSCGYDVIGGNRRLLTSVRLDKAMRSEHSSPAECGRNSSINTHCINGGTK